MYYGLGFEASLLTSKEFDDIYENCHFEKGLHIESFTETNKVEKDWATVVIKQLGELENAGKMATFQQIKNKLSKEVIIDVPTKEYIMAELKRNNIEHLYDKVQPIIYSVCC